MKRALILLTVLAVLGGAGWLYSQTKRGAAPADAMSPSALGRVERRDIDLVAEAAGLVEPVLVVEVKSKAAGEVLRVHADTGDRVAQGTLLAEIDPRDVQSALEQAEADLQSAKVKAEVTSAHRQRMEKLRPTATVTQQEYEAAVDSAAAARALVVRGETAVRLARERRGDVTIRAPMSGTLLTRGVQPGQIITSATANISGGTPLFQMADLTEMQVRAKIDESDIGRVSIGQEASVTVEAYPGRTFLGRVQKVEPQAVVEQNVTLFPVLVRMPNAEGLLRPGMNGEVRVQIANKQDVLAVPSAAVVAPRDAAAAARALGVPGEQVRATLAAAPPLAQEPNARPGLVFVKTPTGIEPRAVTAGLSDWEYSEVLGGLVEGDVVVLVSVAQLQREQKQSGERFKQRMGGGGIIPGAGSGGGKPR